MGASGSIATVLQTAPSLFAWSLVAIAMHLALCLGWERLGRYSRKEMVLASNANIGGAQAEGCTLSACGRRHCQACFVCLGAVHAVS